MQCVAYGKHSVNDIIVGMDSELLKLSMKKNKGTDPILYNSSLDHRAEIGQRAMKEGSKALSEPGTVQRGPPEREAA